MMALMARAAPRPRRDRSLWLPWPGVAIGSVGRNEQPRRGDLDPDVARDVDVADPASAEHGPGARGEVGGSHNGHGARQRAGREHRDLLDCPGDIAWFQSSLDLDGKDRALAGG